MCNKDFMQKAVKLSRDHMEANDGGPFGAIVVKDGEVVAEGYNRVTSTNDPTAHAEVVAIRDACANLNTFSLKGCELYTSCEPCPMCLSAAYWSGVDVIYFSNTRKDAAEIGFSDDFLYEQVSLPLEERSLPIKRIELAEANKVFQDWMVKEDKVLY
jgi:guanine deaminase